MSIRVVYHDNTHDLVSVYVLQLGIECRKIKMFYRDSERRWVTVGVDPVRKARETVYSGPERRLAGKSVEATIPAHFKYF